MTIRILCIALLTALASIASASTVLPLTLADLADRSERVFHGVCLQTRSALIDGQIVTVAEFSVRESLKGHHRADTLTLTFPGGEHDGVRSGIAGLPQMHAGREVVLFVTESDRVGRVWPVGLAQGEFRVYRQDGHTPRVRRDFSEIDFAGRSKPAGALATEMTLPDLLQDIRALTTDSGGRR